MEKRTNIDFAKTTPGFPYFVDVAERAAAEDKFGAHAEAIADRLDAQWIISKLFDD